MQPICPRSLHMVTWVGCSRQNVMRKRLVLSLCIVKQSHYIMWLICFINIRRMFQFPQLIVSPFFNTESLWGKFQNRDASLFFRSLALFLLLLKTVSEFLNFSVVWSKDFFYFEMLLSEKFAPRVFVLDFSFQFEWPFGFFSTNQIFWHLSHY